MNLADATTLPQALTPTQPHEEAAGDAGSLVRPGHRS